MKQGDEINLNDFSTGDGATFERVIANPDLLISAVCKTASHNPSYEGYGGEATFFYPRLDPRIMAGTECLFDYVEASANPSRNLNIIQAVQFARVIENEGEALSTEPTSPDAKLTKAGLNALFADCDEPALNGYALDQFRSLYLTLLLRRYPDIAVNVDPKYVESNARVTARDMRDADFQGGDVDELARENAVVAYMLSHDFKNPYLDQGPSAQAAPGGTTNG